MDPDEGMPLNELAGTSIRVNERDSEDRQTSRRPQLPSPPLTRVGTRESDFAEGSCGSGGKGVTVSVAHGEESSPRREGEELQEIDLGELDPSGDQSRDVTAVDLGGDAVDSKGEHVPSPTSPHPSAHGLTVQPPSPQLWEVADATDSPVIAEVPEGRRSRESKKSGSLQRRLK
jgi:hypothetical protein